MQLESSRCELISRFLCSQDIRISGSERMDIAELLNASESAERWPYSVQIVAFMLKRDSCSHATSAALSIETELKTYSGILLDHEHQLRRAAVAAGTPMLRVLPDGTSNSCAHLSSLSFAQSFVLGLKHEIDPLQATKVLIGQSSDGVSLSRIQERQFECTAFAQAFVDPVDHSALGALVATERAFIADHACEEFDVTKKMLQIHAGWRTLTNINKAFDGESFDRIQDGKQHRFKYKQILSVLRAKDATKRIQWPDAAAGLKK